MDSVTLSDTYYATAGSKMLRFARTNCGSNTFIILAYELLKESRNSAVTIHP